MDEEKDNPQIGGKRGCLSRFINDDIEADTRHPAGSEG